MKPKNIIIALVLLAAAWAIWSFTGKSADSQKGNGGPEEQSTQNSQPSGQEQVQEVPNALEGELKVSNDKKRGNLMLLLANSDRIIYLNTSRDFGSLIGKQVIVSIEGSLDDFALQDIKVK
jgi:hypothetical protein